MLQVIDSPIADIKKRKIFITTLCIPVYGFRGNFPRLNFPGELSKKMLKRLKRHFLHRSGESPSPAAIRPISSKGFSNRRGVKMTGFVR